MLFRHLQNPAVFRHVMLSLDENTLANATGIEMGLEVGGQVILADSFQSGIVEPGVVERLAELPKVLMSINHD